MMGFAKGSTHPTGLRRRGCGCSGHPAFPTPSMGRKLNAQLGRIAPRGREVVSAVIARSEATKQSILSLRGEMDCFASLAMTAPARRMGGAKRYPSVAVGEDDGFREGLNPSYRWRNVAVAVGAWLMFLAAPGAGSAQESFPNRPVRIVIPYSPGS